MTDARGPLRDELPAHALDALEPGLRQRVEAALEAGEDLEAAGLLAEYTTVRDLLPFGLAVQQPPAEARQRLMRRVRGQPAEARARTSGWRRLVDLLRPARWAVAMAALAAALVWNVQLQQQLASADVERLARAADGPGIALVGTGNPTAAARLVVAPDGQRAELAVAGLPPLESSRTYQLWFARPGQPTETGGAFRVDPRGRALITVAVPVPLDQVSAIAVTEEAMPASLRPTGQHLLDGRP